MPALPIRIIANRPYISASDALRSSEKSTTEYIGQVDRDRHRIATSRYIIAVRNECYQCGIVFLSPGVMCSNQWIWNCNQQLLVKSNGHSIRWEIWSNAFRIGAVAVWYVRSILAEGLHQFAGLTIWDRKKHDQQILRIVDSRLWAGYCICLFSFSSPAHVFRPMNIVRFDDRIKHKRIDIGNVLPTVVWWYDCEQCCNSYSMSFVAPPPLPIWMEDYDIQMLLLSTLCQRCLSQPMRSRRQTIAIRPNVSTEPKALLTLFPSRLKTPCRRSIASKKNRTFSGENNEQLATLEIICFLLPESNKFLTSARPGWMKRKRNK